MTFGEWRRVLAEDRCRREVKRNRDEATAIGLFLIVLFVGTFTTTGLFRAVEWAWQTFRH